MCIYIYMIMGAKRRARRAQAKGRQKQSTRERAELRNHLHQDVPLFKNLLL